MTTITPPPHRDEETFKARYIGHNVYHFGEYCKHFKFKQTKEQIKKEPKRIIHALCMYLVGKARRRSEISSKHSYISFKQVKKDIKQNPSQFFSTLSQYVAWKKHKLDKKLENIAMKFIRSYYKKRVKLGKVDIPYIELVLTTKCTLRCESCNNLMQYFDSKNQYTCTYEGIKQSLDKFFAAIDSIHSVRIIGGEPLLFKDLDKVITYLGRERKVRSFNIVTNGTRIFNDKSLAALKACPNAIVCISDYSRSPNLKVPLKQESLIDQLKTHKIPYYVIWTDKNSSWWNPGKIYKRGRTNEDIIRNFKACMMPCVSLMSSEGIRRDSTKETIESETSIAPDGALFICPIASSLSRLKGLREFQGDFINLSDSNLRQRIVDFYAQDFFKACDYCHDMWLEKEHIPIAVQTDSILKLEPNNT